jgi:Flp pilus assembly secretin CpaC
MNKINFSFFIFLILFVSKVFAGSGPIHLTIGESKLIHVESAKKVAIGNSAVADVTAVSDQEILISAKSAGNTNLIFISPDGEKETRAITVSTHNLKKSMVEVDVEVMEIESTSALMAGLSWGSISDTSSTSNITQNNISISENSPPPLVAFSSITRQALSASIQLLINRGKAKILSKPKYLPLAERTLAFWLAVRCLMSLKANLAQQTFNGNLMG